MQSSNPNDNVFSLTLQQSIYKIIQEQGYVTSDITVKAFSKTGDNYMGELFEVDIKGKLAGQRTYKETNLFIKRSIDGDQADRFMSVSDAYSRESYFYNELSKIFIELQLEANIPEEEWYKVAKSYGVSNQEAIVLENLSRKGFRTPNRMDVVPLKYAELSIEQLAKFHAISFAIQKRRPEYFEEKMKPMESPHKFDSDSGVDFVANFKNITLKNLEDSESREKAEKLMEKFSDFSEYLKIDPKATSTFCFGDYRYSNILMKEMDGEITEVIPIDYQSIHYGNPVFDIIFFLFTSTGREFRKEHMNNLNDLYYTTLGRTLKYFDMDVENVYSRHEFENEFKKCLGAGFMVSMFVYPMIFVSEDDAPDFSKDDLTSVTYKLDKRFQERMQGDIDDFVEWGYL